MESGMQRMVSSTRGSMLGFSTFASSSLGVLIRVKINAPSSCIDHFTLNFGINSISVIDFRKKMTA